MACLLSSDFALPCRRSKGGVQKVYLTELSNTASLVIASGVATTFTLAQGTEFFEYNLSMGGSSADATWGGDRAAGSSYYTHKVQIQLPQFETAIRNEIMILGQATLQAIVKDENGKYFLYGGYSGSSADARGLQMTEGVGQTGTASADLNGFNISFTSDELDLPLEIPSSMIAALIAPAV
jgi:hypothetical protein